MRVNVTAGRGGDGAVAFLREAGRPRGPPAGGNGGRGGDIYFVAAEGRTSLRGTTANYAAKHGTNGMGKMMHGKNAEHLVVEVPVGTVITEYHAPGTPEAMATAMRERGLVSPTSTPTESDDIDGVPAWQREMLGEAGEHEDILERLRRKNPGMPLTQGLLSESTIRDSATSGVSPFPIHFDRAGEKHLIVRGGAGGYGNIHFSGTSRSPRERTLGKVGQEVTLQLELKTIADVGLVGLPNAGKSSLLNALSNASSKVADYPFTTLNPFLGTIVWPDARRALMADIPGLVKDAHRNVGLGHDFLRHVERSRVFVFVVDLSDEPVAALETLVRELEYYRPGLTRRPALVVGNKADVVPASQEGLAQVQAWLADQKYRHVVKRDCTEDSVNEAEESATWDGIPPWDLVPLSAKYRANVPSLLLKLRTLVDHLPTDSEKV
ncbi:P-loop containing nucleoside triphosphate hydrolase protein [Blastocladiella britannica]|nr:P-loop containing nucleoside triphosphate hydrolase protein [Blastocladiella britannica]